MSSAALRVKVMRRIWSDVSPWSTSSAIRLMSVWVFPVPAPAKTKVGVGGAMTIARCCGLSLAYWAIVEEAFNADTKGVI